MTTARTDQLIERLFDVEGYMSNHPADPGGETCYGITRRWNPELWLHGPPTFKDAVEFYQGLIKSQNIHYIESNMLAWELLEASTLCGRLAAAKYLQLAHNSFSESPPKDFVRVLLKVDGVLGGNTVAASNKFCGYKPEWERALVNRADWYQGQHFDTHPNPSFDVGWWAARQNNTGDMP